jgi:hypothetical protein
MTMGRIYLTREPAVHSDLWLHLLRWNETFIQTINNRDVHYLYLFWIKLSKIINTEANIDRIGFIYAKRYFNIIENLLFRGNVYNKRIWKGVW